MASASHVPAATTAPEPRTSELDRLERAVRVLIEERAKLLHENESMREELDAMRGLQERLLAEAELRRDAVQRIDDLVGWIEKLEPSLSGASPSAVSDGDGSHEENQRLEGKAE